MIEIVIDFGDNIKFVLLRDRYIVKYSELDYNANVLDLIYGELSGKRIGRMVINLGGVFADQQYTGSFYLDAFDTDGIPAYYLLPVGTVEKMTHLAHVLCVDKLIFTSRMLCWSIYQSNGWFIDYLDGMFHVCLLQDGRISDYSCCTQLMLHDVLQNVSAEEKRFPICNLLTLTDYDLLLHHFDNVFCISDEQVLRGLTKIAMILDSCSVGASYDDILSAGTYHVASDEINQGMVTDTQQFHTDKLVKVKQKASGGRIKESGRMGQREKNDINAFVERESKRSDKSKYLWHIIHFVIIAVFMLLIFLGVRILSYQRMAKELDSHVRDMQLVVPELMNQKDLDQMYSDDSEYSISVSVVSDIVLGYDTIDIMNIVIKDREYKLTVFCRNDSDADHLLRDVQSLFQVISVEEGDKTADGYYKTFTFSI